MKTYFIEIIDKKGWTDLRDKINRFVDDVSQMEDVETTFNVKILKKKELEK